VWTLPALEINEPLEEPSWRDALDSRSVLAAMLLLAGIAAVVSSFIVGRSQSAARAAWTQQQAHDYQASAIKLHGLSHEFAHAAERGEQAAVQSELDKAQSEYNALRTKLESAMGRPTRIAWLLRIGGVVLIAASVGILFVVPPAETRAR
jgi:type II secretory pathway pseudopilin PulG